MADGVAPPKGGRNVWPGANLGPVDPRLSGLRVWRLDGYRFEITTGVFPFWRAGCANITTELRTALRGFVDRPREKSIPR